MQVSVLLTLYLETFTVVSHVAVTQLDSVCSEVLLSLLQLQKTKQAFHVIDMF